MDAIRYAQLVNERGDIIKAQLPAGSKVATAIDSYRTQAAAPGGCKGCRGRRLLRWLAREVEASSDKVIVDKIVSVS